MTVAPSVTDKADSSHRYITLRQLFSPLGCYYIGAAYTQFRKQIITKNLHFQQKINK